MHSHEEWIMFGCVFIGFFLTLIVTYMAFQLITNLITDFVYKLKLKRNADDLQKIIKQFRTAQAKTYAEQMSELYESIRKEEEKNESIF